MEQPLFELYFDDSCKSLGIVQEGFSDTLGKIWNAIVTFFRTLWTNIVKMYNNAITTIKNWFKKLLGIDDIEKENANLKSQVQSMQTSEEKYKKDLADANAKLKETEELKRKSFDSLLSTRQEEDKFKSKSAQLEMDKKCLEKYIEYLQIVNKRCNVYPDNTVYEEIVEFLQKSNTKTIELSKKAGQIITDLKKMGSYDNFVRITVPDREPHHVLSVDIASAYIGDWEKENDEFDNMRKKLEDTTPAVVVAKELKIVFRRFVNFINILQLEYLKLEKIDIEKDFPKYSNDNDITLDEYDARSINNAITLLSRRAKNYQEANQYAIKKMLKATGDFANMYKNIKDIDFYLDYEKFKNKYLDEDGEYTPEIKTAFNTISNMR